jgi:hypothetical protein
MSEDREQQEEVLDSRFARHLNEQFYPLQFPPELARRILTHGSHQRAAINGHNARLSFIGTSLPTHVIRLTMSNSGTPLQDDAS